MTDHNSPQPSGETVNVGEVPTEYTSFTLTNKTRNNGNTERPCKTQSSQYTESRQITRTQENTDKLDNALWLIQFDTEHSNMRCHRQVNYYLFSYLNE
jgi:hypothetical protein